MIKQLRINKMKNLNYTIMRKIAFTLLMLLTLSMSAQNDGVIRFLGIPVDGAKEEMISKLKQKGFVFNNEVMFQGEFNGSKIYGGIETYQDKVYRIRFFYDSEGYDKTVIIKRFNSLVLQYDNNEKYMSNINLDKVTKNIDTYLIDTYEDIGYELKRGKEYLAQYYYTVDKDPSDTTGYYQYKVEEYKKFSNSMASLKEEDREKFINMITSPEMFYMHRLEQDMVLFYITEGIGYGKFNIMFEYLNRRNAPNGQDL